MMRRRLPLSALVFLLTVGSVAAVLSGRASADHALIQDRIGVTDGIDPENEVFAIATLGDTVYVAGNFLGVRPDPLGATVSRPNLAAFDRLTGLPVDTWTPAVEKIRGGAVEPHNVYDVAVNVDGTRILIAGDFTHVNGVESEGLAALDPITGQIDTTFAPGVEGPVWDVLVDGRHTYFAGNFWKVNEDFGFRRVARVDSITGVVDPTFAPSPVGLVEAITLSSDRDRIYAGGNITNFEQPDGSVIAVNKLIAINTQTGAYDPVFDIPWNKRVKDVEYADGKVFAAQAQSPNQFNTYDATTGALLADYNGDGDFQALEVVGPRVFIGGHSIRLNQVVRERIGAVMVSDMSVSTFTSAVQGPLGTWDIVAHGPHLYVAGDLVRAGSNNTSVGGWVRFGTDPLQSAPSQPTGLNAGTTPTSVALTWTASNDDIGVLGYRILRAGKQVAWVDGAGSTTYVDNEVDPGVTYLYEVEAFDTDFNISPRSDQFRVEVPVDGQPPSSPLAALQSQLHDSAVLSWPAATDDSGIRHYRVTLDGAEVAFVAPDGSPDYSYTITGLTPDTTYSSVVEAIDVGGNVTESTPVVFTTLSNTPPTAPENVTTVVRDPTTVRLSWDPSTDDFGVIGYDVYRDGVMVGFTDTEAYVDGGVLPGSTPSYEIIARDSASPSAASAPAVIALPPADPGVIIPFGSGWKYLDNGTNQRFAWRFDTYDDTDWKTGVGQFGYGDNDEGTWISWGPDIDNKYITSYFRRTFELPAGGWSDLTVSAIRDDGIAVYLNGVEIMRDNLDPDAPFLRKAQRGINGDEETEVISVAVPDGILVAGTNLITAEVHQRQPNNNDLTIDVQLTGSVSTIEPDAPIDLAATATSDTTAELTWTAPADNGNGIGGFAILRDGVEIAVVEAAPFVDTVEEAGTFTYEVRTLDALTPPNVSANSAPASVTLAGPPPPDTTAPVGAITFPEHLGSAVEGTVTVTGSVSDDTAIGDNWLIVRDLPNNLFLQPDFTWAPQWARILLDVDNPGATDTTWSLPIDLGVGTYVLTLRTTDAAGNATQAPWPRVKFDVTSTDVLAPTAEITSPTNGSTVDAGIVSIGGTVTDNVAIGPMFVVLRNKDTGEYLQTDGTWQVRWTRVPVGVSDPGAVTSDWNLDIDLAEGRYTAIARPDDAVGNTQPSPYSRVDFVVGSTDPGDVTPPTAEITSPAHQSDHPIGTLTISGTAADDTELGVVHIIVRRNSDSAYLKNDGTFGPGWSRVAVALDSPGATTSNWSIDVDFPEVSSYVAIIRPNDAAGNSQAAPWSFAKYNIG